MGKTWTTRDGRVLKISDMSTDHILNTIRMLERNGFCRLNRVERYFMLPPPQGEMAFMAWEAEIDCLVYPCYELDWLYEELENRAKVT